MPSLFACIVTLIRATSSAPSAVTTIVANTTATIASVTPVQEEMRSQESATASAEVVALDFSGWWRLGSGFCDDGYYGGWVGGGNLGLSKQQCLEICMSEQTCDFVAYWEGYACSRYNADNCHLTDADEHTTYAKLRPATVDGELAQKWVNPYTQVWQDKETYVMGSDIPPALQGSTLHQQCCILHKSEERTTVRTPTPHTIFVCFEGGSRGCGFEESLQDIGFVDSGFGAVERFTPEHPTSLNKCFQKDVEEKLIRLPSSSSSHCIHAIFSKPIDANRVTVSTNTGSSFLNPSRYDINVPIGSEQMSSAQVWADRQSYHVGRVPTDLMDATLHRSCCIASGWTGIAAKVTVPSPHVILVCIEAGTRGCGYDSSLQSIGFVDSGFGLEKFPGPYSTKLDTCYHKVATETFMMPKVTTGDCIHAVFSYPWTSCSACTRHSCCQFKNTRPCVWSGSVCQDAPPAPPLPVETVFGYVKHSPGAISEFNLGTGRDNVDLKECIDACNSNPECRGVEYGADREGVYRPRYCMMSSSSEISRINKELGEQTNLDFYEKPRDDGMVSQQYLRR